MISHWYSILSMSLLYRFKDMITFFHEKVVNDARHDPFRGNLSHTGITLHSPWWCIKFSKNEGPQNFTSVDII